jgi:long-chain acyl-CoA synthetase
VNWAFDVDGTLVGSIRADRARPGARELLAALAGRGDSVVLWSAGGAAYAARKAAEHGLDRWVTATYGKEQRGPDGRYFVDHFAPEHRPDRFVDDAPADLPAGADVVVVSQFLGGNAADCALVELCIAMVA